MRTQQPGSLPDYQIDPYAILEDDLKDVYDYIRNVSLITFNFSIIGVNNFNLNMYKSLSSNFSLPKYFVFIYIFKLFLLSTVCHKKHTT